MHLFNGDRHIVHWLDDRNDSAVCHIHLIHPIRDASSSHGFIEFPYQAMELEVVVALLGSLENTFLRS